jgi:GT2 family glycosyltransferase
MDPDLSVIIVNWNAKAFLKDCLDSIRNEGDNLSVQVIVVDNASSDGSREMVEHGFADIQLIRSEDNVGFARGNNLGIPCATAPFILFLNPDTIVQKGTLKAMADFLKSHDKIGAVGCRIKDRNGITQQLPPSKATPFTKFLELFFWTDSAPWLARKLLFMQDPDQDSFVSCLFGACLMVRREVIEEIGYFDERFFMYSEDRDFCRRITNGGWKIYYLARHEIVHVIGGATTGNSSKSDRIACESGLKLMKKYYGGTGSFSFRLSVFLSSCLRIVIALFAMATTGLFSSRIRQYFGRSVRKHLLRIEWSIVDKR